MLRQGKEKQLGKRKVGELLPQNEHHGRSYVETKMIHENEQAEETQGEKEFTGEMRRIQGSEGCCQQSPSWRRTLDYRS